MFTFTIGGSAYGFQDKIQTPVKEQIRSLLPWFDKIGGDHLSLEQPVTYAKGIAMIVNGLQLNMDHIRFVKEPKASDYFTNVDDEAWYADSLIIAHHNNLDLPQDLDPDAVMSKEAYTHYLFQALMQTGDYAFIELFISIEDSEDIQDAFMDSIQKMIIADIASLDEDQRFHPKADITSLEAVTMLFHAIAFMKENKPVHSDETEVSNPNTDEEVKVIVAPVNDNIQQVTLDWGQQPNPGYGISVQSIEFDHTEQLAKIIYQLHYPEKGKMYPQVIVHVNTVTYIPAGFTVVANQYTPKETIELSQPNSSKAFDPTLPQSEIMK